MSLQDKTMHSEDRQALIAANHLASRQAPYTYLDLEPEHFTTVDVQVN